MTATQHYAECQALAREVRAKFGLVSPKVTLSDLRNIFRELDVTIDYRVMRGKRIQGAYFPPDDYGGASVMIDNRLPNIPRISTLGHELKHHLKDQGLGVKACSETEGSAMIEIGAGVFAAELIWPEVEFIKAVNEQGVHTLGCTPESVVRLRHDSETTLSYSSVIKRLVRLGYARANAFDGIVWTRIEEQLYGIPIYKRMGRGRK